jgi:hypothetical protein
MALEKFRASPLPIPPAEYSPEHFRQLIRVIELYFSQLDSLTPNQAESYRANFFYGGEFIGDLTGDVVADTATVKLLNTIQAYIQAATINTLTANYAKLQSILNNRIVSKDVMADHFYANDFEGFGDGVIFPHIAASDSTDQYADADDDPTLVEFNTLDSGFGWTLNSPGSATASYDGIYKITFRLQFINTANAIHYATVWLQVNGSDVPNSSTIFTIPARKSATPGEEGYLSGYSEITFEMAAGDDVELYWATDQAYVVSPATDGVYLLHDAAQVSPYARPAIPSVIGSITFVSALNKTKVAPLPVYGYGQVGAVTVSTNLG